MSVDTVRKFYASFAAGDAPGAFALLAPEIDWTEAERGPYEGAYKGVPAVVAGVFEPLGADFDNFAATPSEFLGDGDRVAVFGTYTGVARATGRALKAPFVHAWTVAGGKLVRFVQHTDSAAWNAALAASATAPA
ncbi:MAG: nuclear transport factor 2 family protein [Alphaproteobacteria bacterium]|nr:nuclear transport factor 2 family protein [Alphaproteobacteria bacterium]